MHGEISSPDELRKLAAWYREFADRAGEPAIWEARLRTAKELEAEANRVASKLGRKPPRGGGGSGNSLGRGFGKQDDDRPRLNPAG
jgi:hypothetical protein